MARGRLDRTLRLDPAPANHPAEVVEIQFRDEWGKIVQRFDPALFGLPDDISAAIDQSAQRLVVGADQIVKGDVPEPGIVYVRGNRCRAIGRAENSSDKARFVGRSLGLGLGRFAGQRRAGAIEVVDSALHHIVDHGDGGRVEGVGFNDIGAGFQERFMNTSNGVRSRDIETFITTLIIGAPKIIGG